MPKRHGRGETTGPALLISGESSVRSIAFVDAPRKAADTSESRRIGWKNEEFRRTQ